MYATIARSISTVGGNGCFSGEFGVVLLSDGRAFTISSSRMRFVPVLFAGLLTDDHRLTSSGIQTRPGPSHGPRHLQAGERGRDLSHGLAKLGAQTICREGPPADG